MSADRWCLGYPPQPPHVPDGALILTNDERAGRLCDACWRRWNREDCHPEADR